MRAALLIVITCSFSVFAGELGPPHLLLPRAYAEIPFSQIERGATDGTNHLIVGERLPLRYAVLIDGGGEQLAPPVMLPFDGPIELVHWAANYFLIGNQSFVRISADGKLLDPVARALPRQFAELRAASNGRGILMHDQFDRTAYFLDGDGTITPYALPEAIDDVASDGNDFALLGRQSILVVDDRGSRVREIALDVLPPMALSSIDSDGATWFVERRWRDGAVLSERRMIFDKQLQVIMEPPLALSGYLGRGYLGVSEEGDLIEAIAPDYQPVKAHLPGYDRWSLISASRDSMLLVRSRNSAASFGASGYVLSAAAQAESLPQPFRIHGVAADRESAVMATNARGISLIVWRERRNMFSSMIRAARVSAQGELLDKHPIDVGSHCRVWAFSVGVYEDTSHAVATDGDGFLIGWLDCGKPAVKHISENGVSYPTYRIATNKPWQGSPTLASDGSQYAFAWGEMDSHGGIEVHYTSVSTLGVPVEPVAILKDTYTPRLVGLPGGGFFMVYTVIDRSSVLTQTLTPAVVSPDLSITRGLGLPRTNVYIYQGQLALRGEELLLQLSASPNYFGPFTERVLRLSRNGAFLDSSLAGQPLPSRGVLRCEPTCTFVWKESSTIVAAPMNVDGSLGVPAVLAAIEAPLDLGGPVGFLGTFDNPRLLLYQAIDTENGGLQLFVRTPSPRRRSVR